MNHNNNNNHHDKTTTTAAAAAVAATPPRPNSSTASTVTDTTTSTTTRRSKRVLAHQDPIVAPGYGTRKDLLRLTQELNAGNNNGTLLNYETIELVMRSRGRGLRKDGGGSGDPSTTTNETTTTGAAAAASSSAWADFMMEEGMGNNTNNGNDSNNGNKRKAEDETPSRPRRGASKKAKDDSTTTTTTTDSTAASATATSARQYELPPEWTTTTTKSKKAAGKQKKATTTVAAGGQLLQAGTLNTQLTGRAKLSQQESLQFAWHCPVPTRILSSIRITKVFTSCNAAHSFCLDDNSSAPVLYGWGRNESQQLGLPANVKNVFQPTVLDGLPFHDDDNDDNSVVMAAVGKSHSVLLLQDSSLWAVGANKSGQCSVRNFQDVIGNWRKCVLPEEVEAWVQIACGEDFTVALSSAGHMYSCGSSQYGQLGNGETGEYFVTANKLAYANCHTLERRSTFCHAPNEKLHANNDKSAKVVPLPNSSDILIQQVACGKHHTLAVEAASVNARPRIFSFGCGDYGCLGHGVQQDEYFPRMIGVVDKLPLGYPKDTQQLPVKAGAHCSLFRTPTTGHVYYWGKHRSVGEATMRPQLVDVLANNQHVVTSMAAGGQTVICSTGLAQTVSWGQGPHGELGMGKAKSSSKPTFVETLNGIPVLDMAAGYGHTLFVVGPDDKSSAKEVKEINKAVEELPQIKEEDLEGLED